MTKDKFDLLLQKCVNDEDVLGFARKYIIHGTPYVFDTREDEFFDFRNKISKHFNVNYYQVYIVGSGKLGFSFLKGTEFTYESDIDVAIVSEDLYDQYLKYIRQFQYSMDHSKERLVASRYNNYIRFLKYMAKGWMRPDLLPSQIEGFNVKREWFDFFADMSYGKSEVGNYKVSAGVYKSYSYLEYYAVSGLKEYLKILNVEKESKK